MRIGTIAKLAAVLMSCAAIGAAAAVVGSASSPSTTAAAAATGKGHRGAHGLLRGHPGLRAAFAARRAVHAEAVVPKADGSFATLTFDRGKVESVSGQELKITEGTAKATYTTITLTIPADARVRVNGARAALSDVKAGQRVQVAQTPKATLVVARGAG